MICPFRIYTKTRKYTEFDPDPASKVKVLRAEGNSLNEIANKLCYGNVSYKETTCTFAPCHGDECPFYYTDENDVPKCIRCNGPEEEEI